MADENTTPSPSDRSQGPGRNYRQGGNRDTGGLRIRLSDNEMRAARALQEAFGLRSTIAVLGFSLRTLAQQLEQGQLDELVRQHRAQAGARPGGRGGDRRRDRGEGHDAPGQRGPRVDPFARPSRPAAAEIAEPEPEAPAPPEAGDSDLTPGEAAAAAPDYASEPAPGDSGMAATAAADVPQEENRPPATAGSGSAATGTEGEA